MPVSPSRAAAFDILLRVERENSYACELLHSTAYDKLSRPDHALATELVMGVLRWRSRLDDEIAGAVSQPLKKLDLEVLTAIRLAVYQFRFLDRIPQRAALHESVELVKRARKRSAAPFVNAVLRKASLSEPPCAPVPSVVNSLSPEEIAKAWSHPQWLVQRWANDYAEEAIEKICRYNQSTPKTTVRLRDLNAERELTTEGVSFAPGAFLSSARRLESGDITCTKAFRERRVIIQDEASQLVAALVGRVEKKDARILDCCAAPGGKTLSISDNNPSAAITAVEIHPHRARLMQKLLGRNDSPRIKILAADATNLPVSVKFDRILVDVPCSGTGTLARNPEIKWRLKPEDLPELHDRQLAILRSALAHLARGGRLVYSTCSLEREENENVIEQLLAENASVRLADCRAELDRLEATGDLIWPKPASLIRGPYLRTNPGVHPSDGFFAAVLETM
ncbi:MAG TPA: 16S rRNA (cytosine(967)-C(5))-methyltransferase RsmB [Candidatus Sulfotelmatobacter sp.]|nr:16S rRNA (cytosine(967)-C(5))-methyltransferase RsmB [Candidatus Sulfotelmatobacter sp.]